MNADIASVPMFTHYRWVAQLWSTVHGHYVPIQHRARDLSQDSPQKAFGVVLRQLRLDNGYSQESYAHQTGYHRNYIGQLERGEKSPSLKALFDFAGSFELKPSELLKKVEKHLPHDR